MRSAVERQPANQSGKPPARHNLPLLMYATPMSWLSRRVMAVLVLTGAQFESAHLAAQWLHYPTAGVPRKADGKVDMFAPPPRLADGKPDFSGIWTTGEPFDRRALGLSSPKDLPAPQDPQNSKDAESPGDPTAIVGSRQMANIGIDLPGGLPYQPWLAPIVKARTDNLAKDDPHIRCLPDNFLRAYGMPHLLKFVHTPNLLVMLNELNAGYRQVFTDARPLPKDPNPSLQGYSSGKWSGDTLEGNLIERDYIGLFLTLQLSKKRGNHVSSLHARHNADGVEEVTVGKWHFRMSRRIRRILHVVAGTHEALRRRTDEAPHL